MSTVQALIDQWRLHPSPEVGSCANQLAGWLRTQTPTPMYQAAALMFAALRALQKGWDGYGADPLDAATVDRAQSFLRQVSVVPCADGGVQLEWHTHGFDMEIEFEPDGKTLILVQAVDDTAIVESPSAASRGGGDTRPPRQDDHEEKQP